MSIDTGPHSTTKMKDVIDSFADLLVEKDDFVKKTGDTLSGHLNQPLEPTVSAHLANKQYVDDVASGNAAEIKRFEFVGTNGQTSLTGLDIHGQTLEYTVDNLDIFVGGLILSENDYTATNGTSITLTTPLTANQEVRVKAYSMFAVANALQKRESLGDLENVPLARQNLEISAVNTPFTPIAGIAATDVQNAISQLRTAAVLRSGSTMTGPLGLAGIGSNSFVAGTNNAINYSQYPVALKLALGMAFLNTSDQVRGYINSVDGTIDMAGDVRVGGQSVWHAGNFDPASKASLNGANFTDSISVINPSASITLTDTYNQYKIHTSNSPSYAEIRFSFYSAGGSFIATPIVFQSNGNIWSTAFGNSTITQYTWNQGNFNPASKASLTGATFTGPTGVASSDPKLGISRTSVRSWEMTVTADSAFRWLDTGNVKATLDVGGNFFIPGNLSAFSDAKLKENVSTISDALSKVERLRGVEYTRKDNGERQIGVIAQEIQKVLPEVVMTTTDLNGEETLAVTYGNVVAVLIESVKELSEKVKFLEAEVAKNKTGN